ncbi:unnamed protein product [Pelagomonas calceolata]|uniref:RCC1-like domain-containing protein n=1 Tax=Pelagomonas calceolata TaxID=35677 RepID=A0A7S3ZP66_9STRA|nr:unnamed protein product [Pelagomonas calceolata]
MPAKRRGEADARALLRKFGRALDSDDSPTRVRRPGGSGLAAVRSAVSTTTSATAPTSWVAAWGLVPHLPALKKSGPRRSARATPAAVSFRGSIASVACGPAGVVVISEENHAVAAPAEGGRRKVGCRAQSAAVGETVALILNDQSLYAVDPSRDAPRNGSWERPRRLDPFAGAPPFAQARTITGVACGSNHCLARSSCGAVFAWGAGDAGQLGDDDGHDITRAHPTAIVFPADYEPCERGALSAGAHHSALVDGAGALWTWGWTEHGRLGRDSVEEDEDDGRVAGTPGIASLPGGGECIDVSCGAAHTIVVDNNGFVSGCGWNEWGQATGRMNCSSVWHLTPVRFKVPFSAIKVACGLGHSIAVDSNGNAKSWGFGEDGQLGFGREAEKSSPVDVDLSKAGLRNGPACVASIACGGSASVAVVAEAVGSDLEMLRRRRLAIRRVSLYLQALYRGKRARRFYREMLEEELQDRLRRLRRMTDLGIDSRDPTPIKQALESFEDDVGEDSQRAREALRRLACRSQLEEALSNGDDDAAVALVDLAPDHDGDIDALRSGGRRPPRALAGVLCEDAAELCGMQQSVESWRDDLVGYREAKLRLAERSQRELTAAVKLQLWWRGSLATRLALAELFRLRQRRTNAERVEAERRAKRDAEDQYNAATACQSIFRGRAARSARDAEVARRLGIRADAASTLCNFARNWRARRYLKRLRARARRLAREAAKRRERELAERLAAKQKQPRKRTVPKKRDPMHADAVAAARAAREAGQYLKKLEAQDRKAAEEAAQNARQALDAARMKRDRDRRSRLAAKRRAEAEARALAEQQAKAEADAAAAAAEEAAAATPPTPPAPRREPESFPGYVQRRRREKFEEPTVTAPLPKKRPTKFKSVDEWASKCG